MPDLEQTVATPEISDDEVIGFSAAKVRKLPTLGCIGYVNEVGEVKDTEKGVYQYITFKVKGQSGSRGSQKNLFFRPDWFTPGFNAESLNAITEPDPEDGKPLGPKMYNMYRRNIFSESDLSAIENAAAKPDKNRIDSTPALFRGLCGSDANFKAFCKKRQQLYNGVVATRGKLDADGTPTTFTSEEIHDLCSEFFLRDIEGFVIAYELKQQQEKAGEDADGKTIYRNTDKYDLDVFKFYDEVTLKSWQRRAKAAANTAEKAGGVASFKIGFEVE